MEECKEEKEEMSPKERIKISYELLEEAERMLPVKSGTKECMQASEKIWGAWAQATKAYKFWKTTGGYESVIGEIYEKYPQFKKEIRDAHRYSRAIHSDGFYEAISCPIKEEVEIVRKGIAVIGEIIEDKK